MARPQRFSTWYQTNAGIYWIYAEDYFIMIRLSDGKCGRFTYKEFGL